MADPKYIYLERRAGPDGGQWTYANPWGDGVKYVRADLYDRIYHALLGVYCFSLNNPGCGATCGAIAKEALDDADIQLHQQHTC